MIVGADFSSGQILQLMTNSDLSRGSLKEKTRKE